MQKKTLESISPPWVLIISPKTSHKYKSQKKSLAIVRVDLILFDLFYLLDSLINHKNRSLQEHHIEKLIFLVFLDKLKWSNE